jgi:antitoxin component of MazEF toxin-antitoxin module
MPVLNVIPIGNSKGVIIPSSILRRLNSDKIEIIENDSDYTLKAAKPVREGWELAVQQAHSKGDDKLLMDFPNEFDEKEWTW